MDEIEEIIFKKIQPVFDSPIQSFEKISFKDGILVARVKVNKHSFVVKHYIKEEFRREIKFYKLFEQAGIQTLKVYNATDDTLIMEDVNFSKKYHLATKDDLMDDNVLKNLANWYKKFHNLGKTLDLTHYYCEYDVITIENLKKLVKFLNEDQINFLLSKYDLLEKIKNSLSYTITYNDFSFANMIVGNDCAFMFDYNLVGKGTIGLDIINACSFLTKDKKENYKNYYGKENIMQSEISAEYVLGTLSTLIIAVDLKEKPWYVDSTVETLNSPKFIRLLNEFEKNL